MMVRSKTNSYSNSGAAGCCHDVKRVQVLLQSEPLHLPWLHARDWHLALSEIRLIRWVWCRWMWWRISISVSGTVSLLDTWSVGLITRSTPISSHCCRLTTRVAKTDLLIDQGMNCWWPVFLLQKEWGALVVVGRNAVAAARGVATLTGGREATGRPIAT